jgi:hypothetical protein
LTACPCSILGLDEYLAHVHCVGYVWS